MKTRIGFVSNSSSSSFIVLGGGCTIPHFLNQTTLSTKDGCCEFGWGPEVIDDQESRWIMALMYIFEPGIRALDYNEYTSFFLPNDPNHNEISRQELEDMFVRVVTKRFPEFGLGEFEFKYEDWAYIDHQSYPDMWGTIFESDASLDKFLFGNSEIHLDNDNRYYDED